jgi:hypothetical protein
MEGKRQVRRRRFDAGRPHHGTFNRRGTTAMETNIPTIIRTAGSAIMTLAPRTIDRLDAHRIVEAFNGRRPDAKLDDWPAPVLMWTAVSSWTNLGIRDGGASDMKAMAQLDAWIAALPGVNVIDLR